MPTDEEMGIDIDFSALANGAVESDPIAPQTPEEASNPSPFTPEEAAERENFVLRALQGGKREPKERRRRPVKEKVTAATAPPMPRKGNLAKQFTQLYTSLGTFLMPFDAACGGAIINAAPKCGEAMENLARENPAVRKALLAMVETSVWGQVIMAHAPIMLAIAIHHVPAVKNNIGGMAAKITAQAMTPEDFTNGSAI